MAKVMKISVIIQARINSTRLPSKIIKKYKNLTLIELLLKRLSYSKQIDEVILASGSYQKNSILKKILKNVPIKIFFGPEKNVLKRYYLAAKKYECKHIVRITSDCPLLDPLLLDEIILQYKKKNNDYFCNINPPTFPDGMDIEIFPVKTLNKSFKKATDKYDKEHVTSFMRNNKIFNQENYSNNNDLSKTRITLDTKKDLKKILFIIKFFYPKLNFSLNEIMLLLNKKSLN
jgi:spore coat polysaccharide biosynthesis protein SpsF (cytidylyltransferase family)